MGTSEREPGEKPLPIPAGWLETVKLLAARGSDMREELVRVFEAVLEERRNTAKSLATAVKAFRASGGSSSDEAALLAAIDKSMTAATTAASTLSGLFGKIEKLKETESSLLVWLDPRSRR